MSSYSFYIIFISLFLTCQTAVITIPPVSVTVPPFTTTTFTCEGTGDILNWLVESAVLNDSISQQRQITVTTTVNNTNFSSILTVNAIPINDDLGIGCEVITFSPFDRVILGSALTIRGVSPVEDIQCSFTSDDSLLITWSPPDYYSNDIPHGSPVSYQVLVTDGDIMLDTNTTNTNVTVDNITECDTFNVTLTALVDQYISIDNTTTHNGSYSVTVNGGALHHSTSVSIEVSSIPSSHCEKKLFVKDQSDGSVLVDDEILSAGYKNITLEPFKKYQLVTEVKNLRNKVKDTKHTNISTYNIQDVLVSTEGNGSVSVQCVFVSGSTDDGCHVIFTDTSNGRKQYFNIPGSDNSALISLSTSGVYTVTAYDNVNGSLYGPAVYYPIPVEVIKVTPPISTSFSITSESTTISTQSTIVINTINPAATDEPGTNIHVSPTNGPIIAYIIHIVAGTVTGSVLVIFIILAACIGVTVYKRKNMKLGVLMRSEFATIHQPQAETNPYQDVHELRNEVPITIGSPVIVISHRWINEESQLRSQQERPSLALTTTQETTLEGSISSTTSNNIHDNAYTTDPPVTVNVSNDTNIDIVAGSTYASIAKRTNTTPSNSHDVYTDNSTAPVDDTITSAVNDNGVDAVINDTPATVAPTYASIAKRTDTTPLPAVDQTVVYDKVTGDRNKSGDVKFYYHDDTDNIVTGDLNSTTSEDEVAADLSYSPTSYNDSDTTSDPVIECSAESPQASPNDYTYSEAEEESHTKGASTLCVHKS